MNEPAVKESKKLVLTLSWKTFSFILIIALIGLSVYTKPWEGLTRKETRKISVIGEAIVKRVPDAFQFSPYYEAKNLDEINKKTREIITKVKDLGLGDAGIVTNISTYPKFDNSGQSTGENVYTLSLTLTADNKDLAQKIQDYLLTTKPSGPISPSATFSKELQKELRSVASSQAVTDSRAQAEKTAKNLGVKLARVIEVKELQGQEDIYPIASSFDASILTNSGGSLPINAGQSEFTFKVEVIYEIK